MSRNERAALSRDPPIVSNSQSRIELFFFFDNDGDLCRNFPMQPHRDFVFAQGADRLIEHDLAAIDMKVLLFQPFSDVAGGNRAK